MKQTSARMKLYIKNMVSATCKMVTKAEIEKLGFHCTSVELGAAEIKENLNRSQEAALNEGLRRWGLELIADPRSILVNRIKSLVIEMVNYGQEYPVKKK